MFGRNSSFPPLSQSPAFDSFSYPAHLRAKLADLRDFVETQLAVAAHSQKNYYDSRTIAPSFSVNDPVWLSIPTAGKLDARWEGEWIIKTVMSPVTIEITNGRSSKVVHTNRVRHRHIPSAVRPEQNANTESVGQQWEAPTVDHVCLPPQAPSVPQRYPQGHHTPPNRYGFARGRASS